MSSISEVFRSLGRLFQWWVMIMPWEAGIRVTWGKRTEVLDPGIHLCVPLMHTIYKQSVRMRRADMALQTLTT